ESGNEHAMVLRSGAGSLGAVAELDAVEKRFDCYLVPGVVIDGGRGRWVRHIAALGRREPHHEHNQALKQVQCSLVIDIESGEKCVVDKRHDRIEHCW